LTFNVPVVTHGPDGVQRVVAGQSLQFTVTSAFAPGASVFNENNSGPTYLGTGAVPSLATQGIAYSTPNGTLTALSCTDQFWDINFVIKRSGNTVGDKVTFFLQNSSGRLDLFSFTVGNGVATLTSTIRPLTVSDRSLSTDPLTAGETVPLPNGGQTPVLTFALDMNLMDCRQLGLEIVRAGGVGITSVTIADVVIIRENDGSPGTGPGIDGTGAESGLVGQYFDGRPQGCALVCAPCRLCFCGRTTDVRASAVISSFSNSGLCLEITNDTTLPTTGTITNIGFDLPGNRGTYTEGSPFDSDYNIVHDLKATSGAQLFVDTFDFVLHNKSGGNPTYGGGKVANGIAPGDSAEFCILGDFTMLTLSELASGIYPRFQAVNGNDSDVSRLCPCEP